MLFNSYIFILVFLPIVLVVFHLIGKRGHHRIAISWLVGASLFFYGWWNPAYLGLILASIIFNYVAGVQLGKKPSRFVITFGIMVNLGLLGYFKYANFFVDNFNLVSNRNIHLEEIILPLAISFFTFQQITYLVDAYRGLTKEYNFLHYCLFVTFFPQLIAGPIVHHKEMLPQFAKDTLYKLRESDLSVGITMFMLGLFKKVVFADNIAIYATPVFKAAEHGVALTFFEAWGGALAYTFQLYFDFSGYSDMAIGLARMVGVVLPVNFYSPYKANSIIEFWRRWHITLSGFLRDYIYIQLGGNRKGKVSHYTNLMITMLLAGLWHGAGWTFIIWGGMHGVFLSINHAWNVMVKKIFTHSNRRSFIIKFSGRLITFIAVVLAWVMFRAESLDGAISMYSGMFGYNGVSLPIGIDTKLGFLGNILKILGFTFHGMFYNNVFGKLEIGLTLLFIMSVIVWYTPNTLYWMRNENPALNLDEFTKTCNEKLNWKPTNMWAIIMAIITYVSLTSMLGSVSEFLYFQF